MLEKLKQETFEANLLLPKYGLVVFTWGNVSAIDESRSYIVIKPSGVEYSTMRAEDMVVTDMDGRVVEGHYRPSSDLMTHLELYKAFPEIGGVVHTHSTYAAAFAQAESDLPCYGTTHADYYYGSVPCTRNLTPTEIETDYEKNTGKVIVETFQTRNLDPMAIPAVLVRKHGPFTWGRTILKAVESSVVLEEAAKMGILSEQINQKVLQAPQCLLDKHYLRKHGANAYYGQIKH